MLQLSSSTYKAVMTKRGGAKVATGPTNIWQISYVTLSEPGRANYPHLLLLAPSMFFTFRHDC